MTVTCPACKTGTMTATFQSYLTYARDIDGELTVTGQDAPPDTDMFVSASCTNYDECRVSLDGDGDGRLRRAVVATDGSPGHPELTDGELDALEAALRQAVYTVIGHEHPDWAVRFNDDGTMTCTECGLTAPGTDETLTLTED